MISRRARRAARVPLNRSADHRSSPVSIVIHNFACLRCDHGDAIPGEIIPDVVRAPIKAGTLCEAVCGQLASGSIME